MMWDDEIEEQLNDMYDEKEEIRREQEWDEYLDSTYEYSDPYYDDYDDDVVCINTGDEKEHKFGDVMEILNDESIQPNFVISGIYEVGKSENMTGVSFVSIYVGKISYYEIHLDYQDYKTFGYNETIFYSSGEKVAIWYHKKSVNME